MLQIFTHTPHKSETLTNHKITLKSKARLNLPFPHFLLLHQMFQHFSHCLVWRAINTQCGCAEFKQWTLSAGNTQVMLIELMKWNEVSFRVIQDNENITVPCAGFQFLHGRLFSRSDSFLPRAILKGKSNRVHKLSTLHKPMHYGEILCIWLLWLYLHSLEANFSLLLLFSWSHECCTP